MSTARSRPDEPLTNRLWHPAPAARRWWGRILDALFVLVVTGVAGAVGGALRGARSMGDGALVAVPASGYFAAVLCLGALYGCGASPGQALAGTITLRPSGRSVGFWRGIGRYLAIGFLPLTIIAVLWNAVLRLTTPGSGGGSGAPRLGVYRRR